MKTNDEYVKSITPEDKYIKGATDLWVYPNNEKGPRKFVLDRNKNYVIPASYVKYATIGIMSGGTPSITKSRQDSISAMEGDSALGDLAIDGNFINVIYLGGDRFVEPTTKEVLFLDRETFKEPQPEISLCKTVIESGELNVIELKNFVEANPLFIQGAGPIKSDFEIYNMQTDEDIQRFCEKGFHLLTQEEIANAIKSAKEKNIIMLNNRYQEVIERDHQDAIFIDKARNEMKNIQEELKSRMHR